MDRDVMQLVFAIVLAVGMGAIWLRPRGFDAVGDRSLTPSPLDLPAVSHPISGEPAHRLRSFRGSATSTTTTRGFQHMTRPIHLLLAAAALSALLAGCASRPKTAPGASSIPSESPQARPETNLPPGRVAGPDSVMRGAQEDLAATAGDRVFFALDSEAIDDAARVTLQGQAAWLRAHPDVRARIAGNADERGTREYNLALGARRAAAARQALISGGVAATRLETISYGKEQPLDPGSNEEAWAKNRNAQTVVIGLGSP